MYIPNIASRGTIDLSENCMQTITFLFQVNYRHGRAEIWRQSVKADIVI